MSGHVARGDGVDGADAGLRLPVKEGKKVAKIIKAEGKAEQKAIDEAVKELADLQKLQRAAVKVRPCIFSVAPVER